MKFLVFNIVVIAALVHLYGGKDMILSGLLDRPTEKAVVTTTPPRAPAPVPVNVAKAATPPAPIPHVAPALAEVPEVEVATRPVHTPPAPTLALADVDAVQRRADILDVRPQGEARGASAPPARRQDLLSMAEEMEMFAIEAAQ